MTEPLADTAGCLLCFEDEQAPAQAAASATGLALAVVVRHRFPDGEVRLRLPASLPARVVVWRGLHQPNEKLVELLLVAQTARTLGARHLTLVAPYLAYMRQDIAFNPGEAISQRVVGAFLATLGLPTNRAFLAACLQHPTFSADEALIPFLAEQADTVRERLQAHGDARSVAALPQAVRGAD